MISRVLVAVLVAVGVSGCKLVLSTEGSGQVESAESGLVCNDRCEIDVEGELDDELTAVPGAGHMFYGWQNGACGGATGSCTLSVPAGVVDAFDGELEVGALFRPVIREKVLVALVEYADALPQERVVSAEHIQSLFELGDDSLERFLRLASRGQYLASFTFSPWTRLDIAKQEFPVALIFSETIRAAARAMDAQYDLSEFDRLAVVIPPAFEGEPGCTAVVGKFNVNVASGSYNLGYFTLSGRNMGCLTQGRIRHEFAHSLGGFGHSLRFDCQQPVPLPGHLMDPGEAEEGCTGAFINDDSRASGDPDRYIELEGQAVFGDIDVLGGEIDRQGNVYDQMQARWQEAFGWLAPGSVVTVEKTQVVRLLSRNANASGVKLIKIPLGVDQQGNDVDYYVDRAAIRDGKVDLRLQANCLYSGNRARLFCTGDMLRFSWVGPTLIKGEFTDFPIVDSQGNLIERGSFAAPGKPLHDPYRGIRLEVLDDKPATRVRIARSSLTVDRYIVSGTSSVTFSNGGEEPVAFGRAVISGRHANAFSLRADGCSNASLAPGESCSIGVTHTPTNAHDLAVLKLSSSDALFSNPTIGLYGTSGVDN